MRVRVSGGMCLQTGACCDRWLLGWCRANLRGLCRDLTAAVAAHNAAPGCTVALDSFKHTFIAKVSGLL